MTIDFIIKIRDSTKDLRNFPLEELIGSLMTYEMTCKAHEEQEDILPKNRKGMALRTSEDHLRET